MRLIVQRQTSEIRFKTMPTMQHLPLHDARPAVARPDVEAMKGCAPPRPVADDQERRVPTSPRGTSPIVGFATSWVMIGVVAGLSVPAARADICVTCASPDAIYSCAVDGESAQSDNGRLRLYCITALAKSGGHASCAVARSNSSPCAGPTKVLAAPVGLDLGDAPTTADQVPPLKPLAGPPGQGAAPVGQPSPADTKTDEPKTVEAVVKSGAKAAETSIEESGDAAKSAAQSAGSMLQTAGKAVGDAAKKSWTCLSSLFGEC